MKFLVFALALTLEAFAASPLKIVLCLTQHCARETYSCLSNKQCSAALNCNRKCGTGPTSPSCNLLCQLTDGYENVEYKNLLRCMATHNCLPVPANPDGICKAKRSDGLQDLTNLESIKGTWWILKGLNCGQKVGLRRLIGVRRVILQYLWIKIIFISS
jgi:hypothetical protein